MAIPRIHQYQTEKQVKNTIVSMRRVYKDLDVEIEELEEKGSKSPLIQAQLLELYKVQKNLNFVLDYMYRQYELFDVSTTIEMEK